MDWHLESLEIGTLYEYDQDVIKSYSSYICHTPARKNVQTNNIPPFTQNSPLLMIPSTLQQFFYPPLLWDF